TAASFAQAAIMPTSCKMITPNHVIISACTIQCQQVPAVPAGVLCGIGTSIIVQVGPVQKVMIATDHKAVMVKRRDNGRGEFNIKKRVMIPCDNAVVLCIRLGGRRK